MCKVSGGRFLDQVQLPDLLIIVFIKTYKDIITVMYPSENKSMNSVFFVWLTKKCKVACHLQKYDKRYDTT